jgi:hypothetical protein
MSEIAAAAIAAAVAAQQQPSTTRAHSTKAGDTTPKASVSSKSPSIAAATPFVATPQAVGKSALSVREALAAMHLRALVVDDVESNRRMLCRLIEKFNVTTHQAAHGAEALAVMKEHGAATPFDFILLDKASSGTLLRVIIRHITPLTGCCRRCLLWTVLRLQHGCVPPATPHPSLVLQETLWVPTCSNLCAAVPRWC